MTNLIDHQIQPKIINAQAINQDPATIESSCITIGVHNNHQLCTGHQSFEQQHGAALIEFIKSKTEFDATIGTTLLWHNDALLSAKRILFVGLGQPTELSVASFYKIQNAVAKLAVDQKWQSVVFTHVHASVADNNNAKDLYWRVRQSLKVQTSHLYQFALPHKAIQNPPAMAVIYPVSESDLDGVEQATTVGKSIGMGINIAKQLGNLPANLCTPKDLTEVARLLAQQFKPLSTHILDEKALQKLGMNAHLSVSRGSIEPAFLIELHYQPRAKSQQEPTVLIGKGVTFDTGGISLKPSASMDEMKFDMSGAASVIGTMAALAMMDHQHPVIALIPATENMPAHHATKPGDVVQSASGQTIEILNTDAEGRLILCDALNYAQKFNPACIIDVATLTGACVVALGAHFSGLMSNSESLAQDLATAGYGSHDRCWQLPLDEDYNEQLHSNFADMANISDGRGAGTITAACFLQRFVSKQTPWAHLDIAGTAWKTGREKGSTGRPVGLLCEYLIR